MGGRSDRAGLASWQQPGWAWRPTNPWQISREAGTLAQLAVGGAHLHAPLAAQSHDLAEGDWAPGELQLRQAIRLGRGQLAIGGVHRRGSRHCVRHGARGVRHDVCGDVLGGVAHHVGDKVGVGHGGFVERAVAVVQCPEEESEGRTE